MKQLNQGASGNGVTKEKSIKVNTIFNVIKTCSSILFPLITFPYISRVLLPDNVGKVNFAQAFVSYFTLIAALGIQTHAIRCCALVKNDREKLGEVASQFFSINLITTILAYVALAVTLILFRSLDNYRWLIMIESSTILLTSLGADWINSALEDFRFITIRTVLFQIIALILMFVFVKSIDDYYAYAIISVGSSGGANLVNIFYRKRYCNIRFTLKIEWKKHFLPIIYLFVMTLSNTIMSNTDVTMLGLIKGDYEVGLYSTANKMAKIVAQVVQAMALVVIPRLTVFFANKDYEKINVLLRKILNFNVSLGFPCVVGIEMLANDIILLIGGQEYAGAAPILRILILCFLFSLVGGSFLGNAILIPSGKERYYMVVCLITALFNVGLNCLLIPNLGAIGAAISTAINGLLVFILLLFKTDKNVKIDKMYKVFIGPVVGCLMIALCCFGCYFINVFWLRVIISLLSSILCYFLTLLAFKNEFVLDFLKTIKSKLLKRK